MTGISSAAFATLELLLTTQHSHGDLEAAFREFLRRSNARPLRSNQDASWPDPSAWGRSPAWATNTAHASPTELNSEPPLMQTPSSVEMQPVTYRWTSGCKSSDRSLSVTCPKQDPRRRSKSWNGSDSDDDCDSPRRPSTSKAGASVASPTRVRFIYEDEAAKARVCGNVQRLLNVVQKDPEATSANAQVARKILKYRRVMGRLGDVDVEDPGFDASAFFGIEWCRVGAAPSS